MHIKKKMPQEKKKTKTLFCLVGGILVCSPFPSAYSQKKLFGSLVPKASYRPESLRL